MVVTPRLKYSYNLQSTFRPKVKPDEKKNPDENSTSTNGISANENSNETEENDEQNEIRKRRLERFGATNQTSD